MSQEKLKFDLTLSGTYWKTVPEYSIWVDDDCIEKKVIETDTTELFTVSFEKALDDGAHKLQIRLEKYPVSRYGRQSVGIYNGLVCKYKWCK